jgi:hypothetical protein
MEESHHFQPHFSSSADLPAGLVGGGYLRDGKQKVKQQAKLLYVIAKNINMRSKCRYSPLHCSHFSSPTQPNCLLVNFLHPTAGFNIFLLSKG